MKKILAFLFLLISINAVSQTEVAEDTTAKPAITAIGKPNGKLTEMKIGKQGGSLISSDGKIKLIIPEEAVSKKLLFAIQPITNTMPNGNGLAYRLEPSGIQFKQPVQLIFHYDEEQIKDSLQLLLGIAMQDDKGQWYGLNKTELDTVTKIISGSINHFSVWSSFSELKIEPEYARVKVNKTKQLTITNVSASPASSGDDDLLSPLLRKKIPGRIIWHANEILNGNSAVGTIAAITRTFANYKAPAQVPVKNPVAVTATLLGVVYKTKIKGQVITFENLKLVSNILVFDDAYEVTMISEVIDPGTGSALDSVTYRDTGSFVISLNGNQARIIERVNRNITAALNYSGGCCYNYTILKPGHGNIHIAGTPVIKVTPSLASARGATVEVSFSRVSSIFTLFRVTCQCPGDKAPMNIDNGRGVTMMAAILPTQPIYVKFEAKEGEQTLWEQGTPGGQLYSKCTVKQLQEH